VGRKIVVGDGERAVLNGEGRRLLTASYSHSTPELDNMLKILLNRRKAVNGR
jgi:hypothetical protein